MVLNYYFVIVSALLLSNGIFFLVFFNETKNCICSWTKINYSELQKVMILAQITVTWKHQDFIHYLIYLSRNASIWSILMIQSEYKTNIMWCNQCNQENNSCVGWNKLYKILIDYQLIETLLSRFLSTIATKYCFLWL